MDCDPAPVAALLKSPEAATGSSFFPNMLPPAPATMGAGGALKTDSNGDEGAVDVVAATAGLFVV